MVGGENGYVHVGKCEVEEEGENWHVCREMCGTGGRGVNAGNIGRCRRRGIQRTGGKELHTCTLNLNSIFI